MPISTDLKAVTRSRIERETVIASNDVDANKQKPFATQLDRDHCTCGDAWDHKDERDDDESN